MARIPGLVNCSVNFEVSKTAPLDSRTVIDTVLELTQLSTWADESGKVWLYDGLVVAVKENNGLYILSGQDADPTAYSDIANWHRVDAEASRLEIVDDLDSTDSGKVLSASQGKVLSDEIKDLKIILGSALSYKGSVASVDLLPEDASVGDVYNVVSANGNIPAGTNYAWNGSDWDALGGELDLTNYYTKDQVDLAITNAQPIEELEEITNDVKANTEALLVINGSEETTGSIANSLKVAKDYTDTQLTMYVEKVDGSSLITSEQLELITTNSENIQDLQTKVESNTALLEILNGDENKKGSVLNTVNTSINNALTWQELI